MLILFESIGLYILNNTYLAYYVVFSQITLTVEQLPELELGGTYSCQFNDLPIFLGTTSGNNVECDIPEISARPTISPMGNSRHTFFGLQQLHNVQYMYMTGP